MPAYVDLFEFLDKRAICAKEGTNEIGRNKRPRMANLETHKISDLQRHLQDRKL